MNKFAVALPLFSIACQDAQPEVTVVPSLESMVACTDIETRSDLTIAATNDDSTVALMIYDAEGYNSNGAFWEEGMMADIRLHIGTNVGTNHCASETQEEIITEVYEPIDPSELPESLQLDEETSFGYWVMFPLCEGCSAIAEIDIQNFWFVSDSGEYVKIESSELGIEVTANFGAETD